MRTRNSKNPKKSENPMSLKSPMSFKNPQASFEDAIFGANGLHPTPKTLPFSYHPIKTIYGETIEYEIPAEEKESLLKELYPFGNPPPLHVFWRDIHSGSEFRIEDYKVIEQNGYVMAVSPYFAEDGASVVDWEPVVTKSKG